MDPPPRPTPDGDTVTPVDLYWSFRSPYSYLSTPGALKLQETFEIRVEFRPVLPLAVRDPDFFSPDNAKRGLYIAIDWGRRAEMLGMSNVWPDPDPIVQDLATMKIAAEQPSCPQRRPPSPRLGRRERTPPPKETDRCLDSAHAVELPEPEPSMH